jgi:hypothetical protein
MHSICKHTGIAAVVVLALLALAPTALAQAPQLVNYQGTITDDTGGPLATGSYCFSFSVYNGPDPGATLIWGPEAIDAVAVVDGYFNVILGGTVPLDEVFGEPDRFVGVQVGADCASLGGEILPRQQVLSAPFAMAAGDLVGEVRTTSSGGIGRLETRGANDSTNVALTTGGGSDTGAVELFDSTGSMRARNYVDSSGVGYVETRGSNGSYNTWLGSGGSADAGALRLYDASGSVRAWTYLDSTGAASQYLYGPTYLSAYLSGSSDAGRLYLYNGGATKVVAGTSDVGYVNTYGPSGQRNTAASYMSANHDYGSFAVMNDAGESRATMYVSTSRGAGTIITYGPNGNVNNRLTSNSSNYNMGAVTVADANGTEQAGMVVNTSGAGVVWGDSKSFVVKHPKRPGYRIVYVSQEGPEAAIFTRGRVKLIDGRAEIVLPEHFTALAAIETITVNLTPHSLASKGLAVAAVAGDRVTIGELFDGDGSYEVSYQVQATRADKLDHQPVISDQEFRATFIGLPADEIDRDGDPQVETTTPGGVQEIRQVSP